MVGRCEAGVTVFYLALAIERASQLHVFRASFLAPGLSAGCWGLSLRPCCLLGRAVPATIAPTAGASAACFAAGHRGSTVRLQLGWLPWTWSAPLPVGRARPAPRSDHLSDFHTTEQRLGNKAKGQQGHCVSKTMRKEEHNSMQASPLQ